MYVHSGGIQKVGRVLSIQVSGFRSFDESAHPHGCLSDVSINLIDIFVP